MTFLEHIKESLKKVKEDSANKISELATRTVEAIEEIESQKADTSHKHSAGDITSGTLPVTRGGTGATTAADARTNLGAAASSHSHNYAGSSSAGGAATSAVKLQTARTLALGGDVTGSTSFDGSANKTITATLANSGVTAGTYGPLELVTKNNGTVWVSNNVGLHSTSAVCTWTAKQACKVSLESFF